MYSDVPEYNAVSWVTVHLKHQEPLCEHSVTFLKTRIISNTDRRTSILQILSTLSSDCFHCHCLDTNIHTHTQTYIYTHTHTYIHTYIHTYLHTFRHTHTHTHTHANFINPSSDQ
jgi:hypothetical protein